MFLLPIVEAAASNMPSTGDLLAIFVFGLGVLVLELKLVRQAKLRR